MHSSISVSGLLTFQYFFYDAEKNEKEITGNGCNHATSPITLLFARVNIYNKNLKIFHLIKLS